MRQHLEDFNETNNNIKSKIWRINTKRDLQTIHQKHKKSRSWTNLNHNSKATIANQSNICGIWWLGLNLFTNIAKCIITKRTLHVD